jgi:hypothetical protein
MIPAVSRACQAKNRWTTPPKIKIQPKNTAAARLAAAGTTMETAPARIKKILRTIDHLRDFLTVAGTETDVAPIAPASKGSEMERPALIYSIQAWAEGYALRELFL